MEIEGKVLYFPDLKANYFEALEYCSNVVGGRLFEPGNKVAGELVSKIAFENFTSYWIGINDLQTEGRKLSLR